MSGGAASGVVAPFASMMVLAFIFQQMCLVLPQSQKDKEAEYAKRPYKFQFNIEDHHHRKEEKNENGIIMGEFGFVTADFFYLTTVYATDEEGKFRILARSRKYIGPPTEKPPTKAAVTTRRPPTGPGTPPPQVFKPALQPQKPVTPARTPFSGLTGCSNCVVPTTTRRPPGGGIEDGKPFPGTKPIGSPGIGGVIPPLRPGKFTQNPSVGPGNGRPSTANGPGSLGPSISSKPGTQGQTPYKQGNQGPTTSFRPNQATPVQPGSINPAQGTKVPPGSRPGLGGQNQQAGKPLGAGGSGSTKEDLGGPNYKFNYTVGFHGHHEIGYRGGSKEGGYFANHRDGEGQRVVYEANEFGYQPNVTKVRLSEAETPKEETEKDYGLKGYEFKWFN